MGANTSEPKKLIIQGFKDPTFENKVTDDQGKELADFVALINPSSIRQRKSVNIKTKGNPAGSTNSKANFQSINPETLTFQLILDGTGIVEPTTATQNKSVKDLIDHFIKLTFDFKGEIHEPYYLKILWGTFIFEGRLTSCDISYTLFEPNGDPLRAKLDLTFTSSQDLETQQRLRNTNSPDLSHTLVVKEGDTLPLLCEKIYKDSSMYLQVARINGLVNFRKLIPGITLLFPPIK